MQLRRPTLLSGTSTGAAGSKLGRQTPAEPNAYHGLLAPATLSRPSTDPEGCPPWLRARALGATVRWTASAGLILRVSYGALTETEDERTVRRSGSVPSWLRSGIGRGHGSPALLRIISCRGRGVYGSNPPHRLGIGLGIGNKLLKHISKRL